MWVGVCVCVKERTRTRTRGYAPKISENVWLAVSATSFSSLLSVCNNELVSLLMSVLPITGADEFLCKGC